MNLEFYKPPFTDKYKCGYIYDVNSNFMFQFETYNVELYSKILNHLNGKSSTNHIFRLNPDNPLCIQMKQAYAWTDIITIGDWENITGVEGYNFTNEKAKKIQDDLAQWLVYKLNK